MEFLLINLLPCCALLVSVMAWILTMALLDRQHACCVYSTTLPKIVKTD